MMSKKLAVLFPGISFKSSGTSLGLMKDDSTVFDTDSESSEMLPGIFY